MRRLALGLAVLLLAGAAAGGLALRRSLAPAGGPEAPQVTFQVTPGQSLSRVARNLEQQGLVRSARSAAWLARLRGQAGRLHSGEYRLSAALSPGEILARIARGEVVTYEVVLPEGLRAREIAERLEAAGVADAGDFMQVVGDADFADSLGVEGPSLEGYLFPETYRFPRGLGAHALAAEMVEQFLAVWRQIEPRARERGLGMRQVVILASIVEKETGAAEERPLIASVFHNRLRRGMRLESDPTVIYGIPDFDGNLRRVHLEDGENPYNTYRIAGLPPGPIASPGAHALRAVVDPADTDYLYFVSRNDGTHRFSRSYREHVNAVNRFQRRRGGSERGS